jgi:hypothetical protein
MPFPDKQNMSKTYVIACFYICNMQGLHIGHISYIGHISSANRGAIISYYFYFDILYAL